MYLPTDPAPVGDLSSFVHGNEAVLEAFVQKNVPQDAKVPVAVGADDDGYYTGSGAKLVESFTNLSPRDGSVFQENASSRFPLTRHHRVKVQKLN